MSAIALLTIVKNRTDHLRNLIAGANAGARRPDECVIVDMSDTPVRDVAAAMPTRIVRLETDGLPLAAARNRAAREARSPHLLFLDVDCIPLGGLVGMLDDALTSEDALICAEVRYLGPGDAAPGWTEASLLAAGRPHPVRAFPAAGLRTEPHPGLFWSLAFGIRRDRFEALGGFDEDFHGYGAEDTDFGYRAAAAGLPLRFLGGAIACHQHHGAVDPPLQHFHDIVRNAALFRSRWGFWPMAGWLDAFAALGLIERDPQTIRVLRDPTGAEIAMAGIAA